MLCVWLQDHMLIEPSTTSCLGTYCAYPGYVTKDTPAG
jgi:hypothetical protein